MRAINLIKDRSQGGYELEVHKELEKRGAKTSYESVQGESILIPVEELFKRPKLEKRIVGTPNEALISDPTREDLRIKALYERSIASRLGIKMISGTGRFRFPVGGRVTANWFSGGGGSTAEDKIAESDQGFTGQEVVPHYLGSMTSWSLALLKESEGSVNLEGLLRESLTMGLSETLDKTIITGTNANQQPQGLDNWLGTANLTDKTESAGSKWVYGDFTGEIKSLRDAYKNNEMDPMWLMGSKTRSFCERCKDLPAPMVSQSWTA